MRTSTAEFKTLVAEMHDGMEHASMLFHAIGDMGDRLQGAQLRVERAWEQTHEALGGHGSSLIARVVGWGVSLAALGTLIKKRMHHNRERSHANGQ